jgi:hypothetical protein
MENLSTIAVRLTKLKHPPLSNPNFIVAQLVGDETSLPKDPTILSFPLIGEIDLHNNIIFRGETSFLSRIWDGRISL